MEDEAGPPQTLLYWSAMDARWSFHYIVEAAAEEEHLLAKPDPDRSPGDLPDFERERLLCFSRSFRKLMARILYA